MDPTLTSAPPAESLAAEATPDVSAESSPAVEQSQEAPTKTLADVVGEAIEAQKEDSPPSGDQGQEDAQAAPEQKPEADLESDADLPLHLRPRFKEVIQKKREVEAERDALKTEREALAEKATRMDSIHTFMAQNQVAPEEMAQAMHMVALLKRDPAAFAREIQPVLQMAGQYTGDVLPADLAQDVNQGFMTLERAKELASLRANRQLTAEQIQARDQAAQHAALQRSIIASQTSVSHWEEKWKATDPDFEKKIPFVEAKMTAAVAEMRQTGRIPTPEETIALAEKVKAEVENHLRGLLPPKRPIQPTPSGRTVRGIVGQPKNLRDVVDNALSQGMR